jgi:uncharacterized protein (DUF58 family)
VSGLRATLGFGAALLLAGGAFEVPPLTLAGVALVLLASLLGLWIALGRLGASVSRSVVPSRVVEDEPFELGYRVRGGRLPIGGWIGDRLLARPIRARARYRDGPGAPAELAAEGRLSRRGRHRLPPPELLLGDPLGVGRALVRGRGESTILVLPRIEPVLSPSGGQGPTAVELRRGAGDLAAFGLRDNPADPELDGLRPYRPGSSASRIYWPALARAGELVERRLTAGGGAAPLVVLDSTGEVEEALLDRAVRAAASLCWHLGRDGGCELLLVGAPRRLAIDPDLASWPEAHARLAMIAPGGSLPLRELPREGTVFWVVPSLGSRGHRTGGPSAGYLVCAEPLSGGPPVFTVAGCGGYLAGRGRRAPSPADVLGEVA